MNGASKSRGAIFAAFLAVAVILSFAGRASADTKPKFVYVVNSGVPYGGDTFQTYQLTATATCTSAPCSSTISITGSLLLDLNTGSLSGNVYLTDAADLAGSPVAFSVDSGHYFPVKQFYFRDQYSFTSSLVLTFPPNSIPGVGSGGTLCTTNSSSGCPSISSIAIENSNMSPSLLASTGGTAVTGTLTSGTLTATGSQQGAGTISGYSVDSTTGALTLLPSSPFAAGSDPYAIAVDPSNKFVYVANRDSNNVSAYSVDASTGALTALAGSPFATGLDPYALAVDPTGKFLYAANQRSNTVSAFSLNSETGALTEIGGSPFATQLGPIWITIDPVGKYVYVTNGTYEAPPSFSITAYSMDPLTGVLSPIPGSPFYGGPAPIASAIDPAGKFFYSIFELNPYWGVYSFNIQSATGALTNITTCHVPCGDSWPSAIAVHPSGKFLYITDSDSSYVSARTIDPANGELGLVPGSPTGDFGHSPIDPVIGPYGTGGYPHAIALDPSGKFAYTANMASNNISAFTIDGSTGALTPVPGSPFVAGVGPSSIGIVSSPASVAFNKFKIDVNIDQDRKTSFRTEGFFTLGAGSDGIYPLSEPVALQVGSYSVTLPAGSFRERGRHEFVYEGHINDVDLRITIEHADRDDHEDKDRRNRKDHDEKKAAIPVNEYHFTAEGRGNILQGIKNPVAVSLAIGDDEGSVTVKADIDR